MFYHVGKSWTDRFSSHEPQFLLEVACAAKGPDMYSLTKGPWP